MSDAPAGIAPEAWVLIDAFRRAGARSFQDVGVEAARAAYETSCAANGYPREQVAAVEDREVGDGVRVRIYRPAEARAPGPTILFFHGGGWVIGSLETHDGLCRRLTNVTGRIVVAVDYRLAPEAPYPAALEDCASALDAIRAQADALGIDSDDIAVMGDSAGGQMAAVLASRGASVSAQVLLYPVTDLTMASDSHRRVREGFALTHASMEWFAQHYAGHEADRDSRELSPVLHAPRTPPPPAFVCTVGHDPLADEGIAYAGLLARSGGDVEHVHLAGYAHGVFTSAGRLAVADRVLDAIARFLRGVRPVG